MDDFSGLLLIAPIITSYDWKYNFELICDASVYDVGIVLSQRKNKKNSSHSLCKEGFK